MSLFARLRGDAAAEWEAYVGHEFVQRLGDGTLPASCYRRYLVQDYLFLIGFARAYGLAASKATRVEDMAAAAATITALIDVEMPLHVATCAGWGIDRSALAGTEEALETIAYTRFVLDRGYAGDLLDLQVALAPCVVGYAEIGRRLAAEEAGTGRAANPYGDWIAAYAGEAYGAVAEAAVATLDRLWAERGSEARYPALLADFRTASRLEAAFWQMGLEAAGTDGMVGATTERSA